MNIDKARKISELYKEVLKIEEKICKLEDFNEYNASRCELTWVNNDGSMRIITIDDRQDIIEVISTIYKCYSHKREKLIDEINEL